MSCYENLVERARNLSEIAHANQLRKNGEPYFFHPERVSNNMYSDIGKAAAYLHDVLEDTIFTEKDFIDHQIPNEVIEIVQILTKKPKENYLDYIIRVINSKNDLAIEIKEFDLKDNMSDLNESCLKDKYRFAEYLIDNYFEIKKYRPL